MVKKIQYCQDVSPSQMIYSLNTIPIKNLANHFLDIDKLILKFIWRGKRSRINNIILRLTLPNVKTYYRARIIKTVCYWRKNRQINQWNRIENPEIDPQKYSQLIFDKEAKAI